MGKDSALYQLMDVRMNGVMNGIVSDDGEYQQISRKSDEYSGRLAKMELPKEVRLLIDRYVSEQNALGSRYGPACPQANSAGHHHRHNGKCLSIKKLQEKLPFFRIAADPCRVLYYQLPKNKSLKHHKNQYRQYTI